MSDALWVQGSGVTYTDAEDRHLLASVYTQGVVGSGLALSAGVGVVNYTPGFCVIADGAGGVYLGYFDTGGSVTTTATSTIYVRVNRTTAATDVVASTSVPSSATYASFAIGSVTASGSSLSIDPPPANRQATLRGASGVTGFLPLGGGTLTGALSAPQVSVPNGMLATSSGLQAPNGIKLGGAANYTQRVYARVGRYTSRQLIPASAWQVVLFNQLDRDINDYGAAGSQYDAATGRFLQPVPGVYHFSGSAHFTNLGSTGNPRFLTRIMSYTSAGVLRIALNTTWRAVGGQEDFVQWEGTLDCPAGGWVTFEIHHGSANAIYLGGDDTTTGTYGAAANTADDPGQRTWATQTLLMAE